VWGKFFKMPNIVSKIANLVYKTAKTDRLGTGLK
jgi:hypothetical protein